MSGYADRRSPGIPAALRFLAATRNEPVLRERLAAIAPDEGLLAVVALAGEAGFEFSREDLRDAFVHDWAFRRARYLKATPAPDSAASTVAAVNRPSSST